MSFSTQIIEELLGLDFEKTCCKKAFLFGMLFGAQKGEGKKAVAEFKTEQSVVAAAEILKKQFAAEPELFCINRAGRRFYAVGVTSKAVSIYIDRIDREYGEKSEKLCDVVGFRCNDCPKAFLAGVFVSVGTATDPEKRYSLELSAKSEGRAALLSDFLCTYIGQPGCADRKTRIGFYYKGNEAISDILSYIRADKASYSVINAYVGHNIKNYENRATNCVLTNIQKSVDAARRQIEAIEKIKKSGRFELLSEELRYTAELRCENDSATLSELAALHDPSISKSGLNRRLENIMRIAAEIK